MVYLKKMIVLISFFLMSVNAEFLTCDDVLHLPKDKKLNLDVWQSITPKEIVKCLPELGRRELDMTEAVVIWEAVIKYHNDISNISDEILSSLKWVTIGIKPEDYDYLSLSDPDVISNFGNDYGLSKEQLNAIANRVREDFGNKRPEDYTGYDLMTLKQILCVFNGSDIERIHAKAYKEAAILIGRLKKCSFNVLEGFAGLAVDKEAFGSPYKWNYETICLMGNVAKHLPEDIISKLKNKLGTDFLKASEKNVTKEKDCVD